MELPARLHRLLSPLRRPSGLLGLVVGALVGAALGGSLGVVAVAALAGGALGRLLSPSRRRQRRTLQFTREGRYLVAITLGIGFAAINTGNNLLFLVLGMLLSLIIVSGILSEHTLRALAVVRELPRTVHAGRPFLTGIVLRNTKRYLPSFSLQVEDILDGRPQAKKCYFLKVPAGTSQHTSYRAELGRRGLHTYDGLRLSTRFPFAFFVKSRQFEAPGTLVVLPRVVPMAELPAPARSLVGELSRARQGAGREFHGLRLLRTGEDVRDIHWKRSAREGRLVRREYARPTSRKVSLFLNDQAPPGLDLTTPALVAAVDACCDLTASLLVHLTRSGYSVDLQLTDRRLSVDAEGRGLPEAMYHLALLEFRPAEAPTAALEAEVLVTLPEARHLAAGQFAHVFEPGALPAAAEAA